MAEDADFSSFLAREAPRQTSLIQRHHFDGQDVWLKKAGARNPMWGYRLLGALSSLLRLPVLTPIPNPGGNAAIATEARRLRELTALDVRVPALLAEQDDALLMAHLGPPGEEPAKLADELDRALAGRTDDVLVLWREGLDAIGRVHARGACLSQAFARNLLRCPDGAIAFVDFEDDPTVAMALADCQVRDLLCYVHSTAWHLERASAEAASRAAMDAIGLWRSAQSAAGENALHRAIARMAWLRHLPPGLGRDVERARSAAALLRRFALASATRCQ